MQDLPLDLTKVKVQLVQVTAERVALFMRLGAKSAETDKRLDVLVAMRGAPDRDESLVCSIVSQSVLALGVCVHEVRAQLVDCFCIGSSRALARRELACSYTLTHVFCVGAASVKTQSPAPSDGGGDVADTILSTPGPSKQSSPSA